MYSFINVKVFHGADHDIEWLQRDLGLYVVNMFDTGQAARVLSLPQFSLAHLLSSLCGVAADKQYQLADWRIRYGREGEVKVPLLSSFLGLLCAERGKRLRAVGG